MNYNWENNIHSFLMELYICSKGDESSDVQKVILKAIISPEAWVLECPMVSSWTRSSPCEISTVTLCIFFPLSPNTHTHPPNWGLYIELTSKILNTSALPKWAFCGDPFFSWSAASYTIRAYGPILKPRSRWKTSSRTVEVSNNATESHQRSPFLEWRSSKLRRPAIFVVFFLFFFFVFKKAEEILY
jgi:hypothetical protein